MADLYAVLGCARDASADELRAAYKRSAMATHPDRGGSAQAFHTVNRAWRVLGDPERRKVYDETGAAVEHEPDSAIVLGLLVQMFDRCAERILQLNPQMLGVADMTVDMRIAIDAQIAEVRRTLQVIEQKRARINKMLGKLARKDEGPSLFDEVLAGRLLDLATNVVKLEGDIANWQAARKILADYQWTGPEMAHFIAESRFTNSVSGSIFIRMTSGE